MQCTGATRCQIEKREQCNQMVKVEGIIYQSRKADFPFNETHTRLLNCNVLNPSPIINPLLFFDTMGWKYFWHLIKIILLTFRVIFIKIKKISSVLQFGVYYSIGFLFEFYTSFTY